MENHVEERVAMGGKVWVPYPKVSIRRRVWEAFVDGLLDFGGAILALLFSAVVIGGIIFYVKASEERAADAWEIRQLAYEQEYGYTQVSADWLLNKASVVDEEGATKVVKHASFNDYSILYETQAELDEKIRKVIKGDYPHNLHFSGRGN